MVGGRGWGDRQPVPRAKLFCLRFCGRIEFVARFTLILDKHFFSVLDWRREGGGEVARKGRSYPIGRQTYLCKRRAITPKAAAAGVQDVCWRLMGWKGIMDDWGQVRPSLYSATVINTRANYYLSKADERVVGWCVIWSSSRSYHQSYGVQWREICVSMCMYEY